MTTPDPSRTASSVSRKAGPLYSSQDEPLAAPSLSWQAGSTFVMGTVGVLVRTFFHGLSRPTVTGLEEFTKLLDERKNVNERQRGMITGM
jgi:monolysocardiolipin acyltransferase